jgi:hypothetical protein
MYRFKWQLCKKTKVLVLVCCYKARGDIEQELWRYWLPEGCIKQWCDKPSGYGCLSKKCEQGEQWSSDIALSCTLAKLSDIQSENTKVKRYVSHYIPVPPVTLQLHLCFLYCFSGVSALLLLTYVVACKFWSFQEFDYMDCHPRPGFHYSKRFIYLCNYYSRIIKISGINFDGSEYRKVSKFYPD